MPLDDEYGQILPTEADVLQALGEVVGPDMAAALWEVGARTLGLARPVSSPEDLRQMAEHLMSVGELTRVSARSLKVRVITHDALSRTVSA
jgi:hypothetical protein